MDKQNNTREQSNETRKVKTDRFGKPISKYFTTSGFPRLKLWREMQKGIPK